ncbi:MAG: DUF2935 domain-containing protein [Lachnospiraceae bacterium]|nr:DUF2935 domain-containing protein [Lachnospiraceae bacterium]
MPQSYVTLSLETHLFFARIMKEHALFLEAGFPCINNEWIEDAESFRQQFEELLAEVIAISNGRINCDILNSNELVTEFTLPAEERTACLSGVAIDTDLTKKQKDLEASPARDEDREIVRRVHQLNARSLPLLNDFIAFKEAIIREMDTGNLFTANYPLLVKHIQREAKLYRATIQNLMNNRQVSYRELLGTENFWNQIMMEHALFIRGLLDPCEEELIKTAHEFSIDYKELLNRANCQNRRELQALSEASLEETLKYRDFKAAGTKGILNCEIDSIILPLLADHVLREANHYIRLLESTKQNG